RLATEPQIGAKTLLEILAAGSARRPVSNGEEEDADSTATKTSLTVGRPSKAVQKAAAELHSQRWSADIHVTDLRLGKQIAKIHPKAATAREAAERVAAAAFDTAGARRTAAELRDLIATANRLRRLPLD